MSRISGVSYQLYGQLASGKRIQRAADGAAELSILQKQNAQIGGLDVGAQNIQEGKNLLNIADGAMSGVTDYLQRMDELAIRASNGLMSDSDRANIQMEIDQLKEGISGIANTTTYNTKHLLNGTEAEFQIMMGTSGSKQISTGNALLDKLGIADFDVTGDFDVETISKALEQVSAARSKSGAQTNALEHAYNYNRNAAYNLTASSSRIGDTDYGKAVTEQKKQHALQQYAIFAQKKRMENQSTQMLNLMA